MRNSLLVALCATAIACVQGVEVANDGVIACDESRNDCPSGLTCRNERCVQADLESTAPEISNVTVSRVAGMVVEVPVERFAPGQTLRISFDANEALVSGSVRIDVPGAVPLGGSVAPGTGTFEVDVVVPSMLSGNGDILIEAVDGAGNIGIARLPSRVFFDSTSPELTSVAQVAYEAASGNLQRLGVDAATVGTTVRVSFTFRESLQSSPAVRATFEGSTLTQAPSISENPFFEYLVVVDESTSTSGSYVLVADATDLAGNSVTDLDLGASIAVDVTPPSVPTNLRFEREPWGALGRQGSARFAVAPVGSGSSGDADSQIVFFDQATTPRLELGRVRLDGVGAFGASALNTGDRVGIFAIAIDSAGNESTPVEVSLGRWVATFQGKTNGNTFDNPHAVTLDSSAGAALFNPTVVEPDNAELATLSDCETCDGSSEAQAIDLTSSN
ncbi:MAG: hypothetical protein AAF658_15995, partial [Myxococcota bacterium]